ncbi:MAG: hypothetical protein V3T98_01430 [Candidatus Paceibacterota bacterium]
MENKSRLEKTFRYLIIIFIIILVYFLIPYSPSPLNYIKSVLFPLIAILGLVFLILGVKLTFIARKEKGKLKLFLMLTGISAVAPLPFAILHNLFYGLAIIFENFKHLFEALHVASFIIAIVIAPIIFIVGAVGSIFFFKKGKIDKKETTVK